jgi:hypothetical protein
MVLTVILTDRDDGGLDVGSHDLPGLILSGSNKHKIMSAIPPAIKALLEHKGFRRVRVHQGTPPSEILKLESPRNMDVHVQTGVSREQFVVEIEPIAA